MKTRERSFFVNRGLEEGRRVKGEQRASTNWFLFGRGSNWKKTQRVVSTHQHNNKQKKQQTKIKNNKQKTT